MHTEKPVMRMRGKSEEGPLGRAAATGKEIDGSFEPTAVVMTRRTSGMQKATRLCVAVLPACGSLS